MKSRNHSVWTFAGAVFAVIMLAGGANAQSTDYNSLRGKLDLEQINPAPPINKLETPQNGFARSYRQQPPLVPHKVDEYQVTTNVNQCLDCHDWPNNTRYNATKISETHYEDRAGTRLDKVAGTRYFCTSCHVPQMDAKPLVRNIFKDAAELP